MTRPRSRAIATQASSVLAQVEQMEPEAMRGELGFTQPMLDVLRDISLGLDVRNSTSIIALARLRVDACIPKLVQGVAVQQHVTYRFFDPYSEAGEVIDVAVLSPELPAIAGESVGARAERVAAVKEKAILDRRRDA